MQVRPPSAIMARQASQYPAHLQLDPTLHHQGLTTGYTRSHSFWRSQHRHRPT